MKKILVPVDFSESAANALRYALELNRHFSAKITLLYVFDMQVAINILPPELNENYIDFVRGFEEDLQHFLDKYSKEYSGYEYEIKVLAGEDNRVIVRYAATEKADLIIIGNKGVGGLRKWFFGSVAKYVLTHSPIPVIAIPVGFSFDKIRSILLASDFLEEISGEQHAFLTGFADKLKADIDLVHVNSNGLFKNPKKESIFRYLQLQFNKNPHLLTVEKEQDVDMAIKNFMEAHNTGLTVIIPHEHMMLDSMLSVNHTERLMALLEQPLMTIPSMERQNNVPA